MVAVNSFNLSNVYLHLGSIPAAAAALDEAIALRDRAGKSVSPMILGLHNARMTARRRGIEAAAPEFERLLAEARRPGAENWLPVAEELYAIELLESGRVEDSALHAGRAVELRAAVKDGALGGAYLTLSLAQVAKGNAARALESAGNAIGLLRTAPPRRPLADYFAAQGKAHAALGQWEAAREDFRRAVDHARTLRPETLPSDQFQVGSTAKYDTYYRGLAEANAWLYWRTGDRRALRESLEASLENRARALRSISLAGREPPAGYRERLSELQAAELNLLRTGGAEAAGRVERARLRLSELDVDASRGLGRIEAPRIEALQESLGDAALLHFHAGERQSLLWLVTRESVDLLSLPAEAELERRVMAFRRALEEDRADDAALTGHELYKTLLGAAPAGIRRREKWILAPDAALFHLPFGALVTGWDRGKPRYLVEERELMMAQYAAQGSPGAVNAGTWEGFGDPVYNTSDPRFTGWQENPPGWHGGEMLRPGERAGGLRLPRLPGTLRELNACSRLWPAGGARMHVGPSVNLEGVRAALARRPEVLHLATHLVPASGDGNQSQIVLSLGESGNPEVLDTWTAASLDARGAMVVMTGCQAGSGTAVASEGLLGLTRSWLAAGAEVVTATYWPMPDDSGELITTFYRHWRQASTAPATRRAAEALRFAQLDMIRSESWRARPRYWASYFVMGKY
jgi:CHAT domain-containing protein